MTYAEIKDGKVVNVIIADADFIAALPNSSDFVEYNLAGIGWNYDGIKFYPAQCHSEAMLNNYQWTCSNAEHDLIPIL
jgi:hypothetical protein